VKTGEEVVEPLKGHTDSVWSVAFSPDGTRIISGSLDKTIRIWDVKTGEEVIEPLKGHTDSVLSVAFSPDGTRVISGSLDKTIRIWDVKTGEEVVEPLKGHTSYVFSAAFSPDGTRIVSGSDDKAIRIWDAKTGEEVVARLKGHTDFVCSVAFSPDGTRTVSSSDDRTIMTGEEVMKASWHILTLILMFSSSAVPTVSDRMPFHFCRSSLSPSDGWIHGPSNELIFWVLPEWRPFVVWPPCLSLIAESRIIVDPQYFVHGTAWTRCFASPLG
jgi:WD40 repeat protein